MGTLIDCDIVRSRQAYLNMSVLVPLGRCSHTATGSLCMHCYCRVQIVFTIPLLTLFKGTYFCVYSFVVCWSRNPQFTLWNQFFKFFFIQLAFCHSLFSLPEFQAANRRVNGWAGPRVNDHRESSAAQIQHDMKLSWMLTSFLERHYCLGFFTWTSLATGRFQRGHRPL